MRHVIEDLDIPVSKYIRYRKMIEWASIFHCDAMVCIQSEDFLNPINFPSPMDFMKPIDLIVCNLVLREFKIVPRPANVESVNCQLIGFEYDSKTENYKIMKIVFGLNGVKAKVHTLRTTTWREIEINTSLDITMPHQYDYLNGSGVCYWAMQESPTGECKILCFNICDKVFQVIPFSRPTSFKDFVACAMWNGKLCVFLESIERVYAENACQGYSCQVESTNFKSTFEMWVMDTIEGDHHWTKHAIFGPLVDFIKPIKFWNNDELLLWVDSTRSFSFYNLRTQRFKNITIGGDALFLSCLYFKSLISIDGQKIESKI